MRAYVDSDIVMWILRGHPQGPLVLRRIQEAGDDAWMAAMQRAEVVFYLRPGERAAAARLLAAIPTEPLTAEVVDLAATMFQRWNPSHGVGRNDAMLAATAVLTSGRVVTNNLRHFPMPEVRVERGWDPGG